MSENLSITIGPVYKTLKQARSTREIWVASYFFSALMREILKCSDGKFDKLVSPVLLPDISHRYGAGIYPDRAFWTIKNAELKNELASIIKNAAYNLSTKWKLPEKAILNYVYCCGYLMQPSAETESTILDANKVLDDLELEESIHNPPQDILESLVKVIQNVYDDGHQQAMDSIFENYSCPPISARRLPSLIEITTRDLKWSDRIKYNAIITTPINTRVCSLVNSDRVKYNEGEQKEQDAIVPQLKTQYGKQFKFRHKYVAFIKADGDYMGSTLGKIGNVAADIDIFSTLLSGFAGNAVEIIHNYGGVPIYAGGDDLLFALPLANTNENTVNRSGANIFELINKLDEVFPSDEFAALVNEAYTPTMSYGISFCYYKYPMDEILDAADKALNDHAKKHSGKNAVSFSLRKHSGQTISATFGKGAAYKHFVSMVSMYGKFDDDAFLSGLMYKLESLKLLLTDAVINGRLEYLFKNQFNEAGHSGKYKNFLGDSRELFDAFYTETLAAEGNTTVTDLKMKIAGQSLEKLFACLRFIQFFNQDDHE